MPVTAMPTVPSVETIPSSFIARRNSAANIWKAITPADRGHNPGEPKTIPCGPASKRLKRISYCANAASFRRAQQWSQNMRKHVRVLVAVNMRQRNSPRLNLANLRFHFPLNFFRGNLLADRGHGKMLQAAAEPLRPFCECWKIRRERNAIDQYDVTSCLEARLCIARSIAASLAFAVGHERSRSHNAGSIALDDRAVYARGQAKIICINNEATHWVSLTKTIHHKGYERKTKNREMARRNFLRNQRIRLRTQ